MIRLRGRDLKSRIHSGLSETRNMTAGELGRDHQLHRGRLESCGPCFSTDHSSFTQDSYKPLGHHRRLRFCLTDFRHLRFVLR